VNLELFFLNSGTTWASFNFSGKMELFIDLFIKFAIGLTIAGFANFRSFAEMPSRPVAFFEFNNRPVSILPTISKFYERAIYEQTVTFFDRVFHPSLLAFRSGYGCQTALLKIIEDCPLAHYIADFDTLFSVREIIFYQFQCRFTYSVCI
jgi:hypothetical protein